MSFDKSLGPVIDAFKARQPMRAKSLIVTLFGDVVSQHGRQIWLGSIASAFDGLGVNDRLVRTSVFRLVKENWLDVERAGRKSFYRFTDTGSQEYQRAAQRIYSSDAELWRGTSGNYFCLSMCLKKKATQSVEVSTGLGLERSRPGLMHARVVMKWPSRICWMNLTWAKALF